MDFRYNQHCCDLGIGSGTFLGRRGFGPGQVAFDMDGVVQVPAIQDTEANRRFYQDAAQGLPIQGSVSQEILFYPGMRAYFLGMSRVGAKPIIVSSMSFRRMAHIIKYSPQLRAGLFGSTDPVDVGKIADSPRVFVAQDLVRGMGILLDIHQGIRSAEDYPPEWAPFIAQGIRALFEKPGEILKLPIVVSLSKSEPQREKFIPLYRLLIEDTESVVQGVLHFSEALILQPSTPWSVAAPFHEDPTEALKRHNTYHTEELNTALRRLLRSRQRHQLIDVSGSVRSPHARIITHYETAEAVVRGHFGPLRRFRERLSAREKFY